jgi:hypothetical protein
VRIPVIFSAVATAALLAGGLPSWAQDPAVAVIPTSAPIITSGANPYMEMWAGIGATGNFFGGYIGGNVALNSERNVWSDGFIIRGEAIVGQYDGTSGFDDVVFHNAALMLGYRMRTASGLLTGYVGANYETHNQDDPTAGVRGTEVGWKALIEYYTLLTRGIDFYGQAYYSSAFEAGGLFARVGFNVAGRTWVGPELSYFRNEAPYREQKVGAFIRFEEVFYGGGLTLQGGWVNPLSSNEDDGWYLGAGLYFPIR